LLFTCAASPRTLSLAASLGLPRQRQAGRLELPRGIGNRLATAPSCHEKDASLRLLQPTPVTSTLRIVRFPSALRRSLPGGASLDGEPPASAFATTITTCLEPGLRTLACGVKRGPGGAPIDGSSALHLPVAVFSTACRADDVASDVLCCAPRRIQHRCRIPVASGRRPGSAAVSSKTWAFAGPGRLPSPSAPSPEHADACAPARGIKRSRRRFVGETPNPRPSRVRCSRARGFRHREPASGALSPMELARLSVGARG